MLTIRLSRVGKKNKPTYRLIISEKAKDPYGRALEILGSYNPHNKDLKIKSDRVKYWLEKGSQMSPTVNNLLIEKKIIEGEKQKTTKIATKKRVAKQKDADKAKKEAETAKVEENEKKAEETKEEEKKEEKPETEKVEEKTEEAKELKQEEEKKE